MQRPEKTRKGFDQKNDYEDELRKSRNAFDEKIKQIEQDVRKDIEQETKRFETLEEYSYTWSESKAKIELANEFVEEIHKEYELYLKKRPKCLDEPPKEEKTGQDNAVFNFKDCASPHEYFSTQERALLNEISINEDRLKTRYSLLEGLNINENIEKLKETLSDLRSQYRDFCSNSHT